MPGDQLPRLDAAGSSQQCLDSKNNTYLAKIAVVLQGAPNKMLTFTQLMDKLPQQTNEDRKSVENNIRVCLSINKCFVKIPVDPDLPGSKKNYWKLDPNQITGKMVRRHFKGLLQLFPELASKVEMENMSRPSDPRSGIQPREPVAIRAVQIPSQVKFTGPFSIDSLTQRDDPPEEASGSGSLVPVRDEQQPQPSHGWVETTRSFSWNPGERYFIQASAGSSSIYSAGGSTLHDINTYAATPFQMMHMFTEPPFSVYTEPPYPVYTEPPFPVYTEPPFPVYTRPSAAHSFTSPRSGCYTYPRPTFTSDAFYFSL